MIRHGNVEERRDGLSDASPSSKVWVRTEECWTRRESGQVGHLGGHVSHWMFQESSTRHTIPFANLVVFAYGFKLQESLFTTSYGSSVGTWRNSANGFSHLTGSAVLRGFLQQRPTLSPGRLCIRERESRRWSQQQGDSSKLAVKTAKK